MSNVDGRTERPCSKNDSIATNRAPKRERATAGTAVRIVLLSSRIHNANVAIRIPTREIARINLSHKTQLVILTVLTLFPYNCQTLQGASNKNNAEGPMDRMLCSNTRVKSNACEQEIDGPKELSADL